MLNVVAVNMEGGSGHLSVGTGGVDPVDEATTPFAVLTPKMNNGATTIVNYLYSMLKIRLSTRHTRHVDCPVQVVSEVNLLAVNVNSCSATSTEAGVTLMSLQNRSCF